MNVHLAVPDLLWPDRETPAPDPGPLPALEMLVARGRRKGGTAPDLESWLLAEWQAEGAAAHSLVADGGAPGDGYWARADPCSLRVSRDAVVPLDPAVFDLTRPEAEALVAHLNRHFADRGLAFHALQPERWYLRLDAACPLDGPALAAARGKPLGVRPGADPAAARRAALVNEIQMALHEHPVNEAREARGEPPVNAVWLWGGGRLARPAARPFRRVRTRDALAAGLALGSGAGAFPLPESAAQWLRAAGDDGVELVVLDALRDAASYAEAERWRTRLAELERDWFAPFADALARGRIGMLTLHAIGAGGTLDAEATRTDLRRFWRRRQPVASYAAR
jgi:hypothetical protein